MKSIVGKFLSLTFLTVAISAQTNLAEAKTLTCSVLDFTGTSIQPGAMESMIFNFST